MMRSGIGLSVCPRWADFEIRLPRIGDPSKHYNLDRNRIGTHWDSKRTMGKAPARGAPQALPTSSTLPEESESSRAPSMAPWSRVARSAVSRVTSCNSATARK